MARSTPTSRTITTTSTISSNSSNSNNSRRVNRRCRVLAREGPAGRGAAWPGPEACSAITAPRVFQRRDYHRPWSILSPRLTPVSKNSIPSAASARACMSFYLSTHPLLHSRSRLDRREACRAEIAVKCYGEIFRFMRGYSLSEGIKGGNFEQQSFASEIFCKTLIKEHII